MPFLNNNVAFGLPASGQFQAGHSNFDNNSNLEEGKLLPWAASPAGSYIYYDCTVAVQLDSGIVVHTPLPQVDKKADTLSSVIIDAAGADRVTHDGVNLKSNDTYQDIVQRMAHSRYWFHLYGQAIRIGYRIPIPAIEKVGGVAVTPHDNNPQWAFNRIAAGGNIGGLIIWHAQWSLWYTITSPPTSQYIPEVNPGAHISGTTRPPDNIQVPFSQADPDAVNRQIQGFFQ